MHQIFRKSSAVLRVFALILACFFSAVAALAQEKAIKIEPSVQPQASSTAGTPEAVKGNLPASDSPLRKATAAVPPAASTSVTESNDSVAASTSNASSDYKKNLTDLKGIYEREVLKLEQQNSQLKGLYQDGLIARVDMEKSDHDLADARARVEVAQNQIVLANQPKPTAPAVSPGFTAADAVWSTGNNRVDTLVRFYGNKYGVDPYLIYCLMNQESRFAANATSPKGAQGLMQMMPGTAARYGVMNPYDVAQSIMGGTRYLKDLLQMFNGRIDLALAGYNAGENAVIKHGYTVPPYQETRNYVRLITAKYARRPVASAPTPAL